MSVPWALCPMPAATAAPAPPDEPPGVMPGSRGFLVSPWMRLVVNQRYENAGQLVRPRMTAPDLRRLSITGLLLLAMASRCSLSPLVVAKPSWSILTFTVTGTPPSGPASSPRAMAASTAAACVSTSSGLWSTTALILGLTASSRASAAVAASFAETFFDLTSEAISAADRRHRSCMQNSISIGALVAPGTGQCQRVGRSDLAHAGDVMGEIDNLLRRDRTHHVGHAAVVAMAAVVLVFAERLGEIILALTGDARDVFLPRQIGVVTG